ncbi:hypothetical protein D3C76_1546250 [compost metagenome]
MLIGVELVAQPGGLMDRVKYGFKVMHRNLAVVAHYCFPLLGTVWKDRQAHWPLSVGSQFGKTAGVSTNDICGAIHDF